MGLCVVALGVIYLAGYHVAMIATAASCGKEERSFRRNRALHGTLSAIRGYYRVASVLSGSDHIYPRLRTNSGDEVTPTLANTMALRAVTCQHQRASRCDREARYILSARSIYTWRAINCRTVALVIN